MLTTVILLLALLTPGAGEQAQVAVVQGGRLQEGRFDRTVQHRTTLRYLLYLPREYGREDVAWPLILYLHGGMGRGTDFEKMSWYPLPRLLREPGHDLPFVVLMPQCPEDDDWGDPDGLSALLDEVIAAHAIDPDRVYLAGYSMGGTGAWRLAYSHPDQFAAVAPMSGFANPHWARRLKDVPIWAFHGAKDTRISPSESEEMVTALRAEGGDVRFSLDPERAHAPPSDEDHIKLFEWFLKHRRGAAAYRTRGRPHD